MSDKAYPLSWPVGWPRTKNPTNSQFRTTLAGALKNVEKSIKMFGDDSVEDNLQAIHHCIEAERVKLRHGGINMVRASFQAYTALPPPSTNSREWYRVLGVNPKESRGHVTKEYKRLRARYHPDNLETGDRAKYDEVVQAMQEYNNLCG